MKQLFYKVIIKHSDLFKIIFATSLYILLTNNPVKAQDELDVIRNSWLQYTDAANSLYHFLSGEAFKSLEMRVDKVKQINTKDDLLQHQAELRQKMWELLGPFPEKTPLNSKITSTVKKIGYRVENVIYESLPGFYVTASLFIPDNIKEPAPAILFCSGHSSGVYRLPYYQLPLLNLVKKGFIVLAIDPVGQGERLQYYNTETKESTIGGSTKEHSYFAAQVFTIGMSSARYFVWDGIRGIDYLMSRKKVDPERIGVHGLSGGGTQTAYVSALDERVLASAPAGYITSYRRLLESMGVGDAEQNFYHGISGGIDQADYIEIRAPKPTLIMATTRDFFSIQGTRETYAELEREYTLLGNPGNIEITEDDADHDYTKKNREAMYAFFQKYLQLPGSPIEEEVDYCSAQELQKTHTGQISTSLGGETVFSINRKEAEKLISKLQDSRGDLTRHLTEVLNSAKKLSGYQEPSEFHEPVFTGRFQKDGYVIEKYFVKGEGDYVIPYLLLKPDKPNNKALIYLHPSGKSIEASPGGEMELFAKNGITVLAPDMIGIGETGPGIFKGDSYIDSVSYNLWYTSMLIGRSIVGIRAGDVVRLTRVLQKEAGINDIYGFARKEMSPVLLHAAAFCLAITRIALIDPYSSYQSIVMNRFYKPKFVHSIVPGALTAYDLPDLGASLAPRKLLIEGITDGNGRNSNTESIYQDMEIIRTAYKSQNATRQLSILLSESTENPYNLFIEWIK
jgi:cephalosporin-C deacetylase-like acetyl esterase